MLCDTSLLQLVFAVFTGEAWGYLGSRRFLLELDQHSDAVSGLDAALIETVYIFLLHNFCESALIVELFISYVNLKNDMYFLSMKSFIGMRE